MNTAIVLIKRKNDSFVYNNINDLEGKNIGVIRGSGYLEKIQSGKIQKSVVSSLEQNLRKPLGNLSIVEPRGLHLLQDADKPPEFQ